MDEVPSLPRFGLDLLHPRYWLLWTGIAVFYLFTRLPISVIDAAAMLLGKFYYRFNEKRVRFAKANLRQCFPDIDDDELNQIVSEHCEHQMRSVLHYGVLWWGSRRRLEQVIDFEGKEVIERVREQGKQVIALTSHSVGLEFSVTALGMSFECSGPYKQMKNRLVDWLVARGRTRFDVRAFSRDDGLRPVIRDTRKGRVMIYLADEDLGPKHSVFAPLFAAQKATLPVLARIAKQCDAEVVPCTSCYDTHSRRYVVKCFEPLHDFQSLDPQQSANSMNKAVEQTIKACIAQYFWTLRLFKTRPNGEESIYAK